METIARRATGFDTIVSDGYATRAPLQRPSAKRAIVTLTMAASLTLSVIVFPAPSFPSHIVKPNVCTLACNPNTHTCSRYPSNQIPLTMSRPRSIPDLYRVVPSGTRCDSPVCVQDPYMCVIGDI
ncbi:MAG TPA: hypothetical protein VGK81_07010 [Anaerolineae bacterium]